MRPVPRKGKILRLGKGLLVLVVILLAPASDPQFAKADDVYKNCSYDEKSTLGNKLRERVLVLEASENSVKWLEFGETAWVGGETSSCTYKVIKSSPAERAELIEKWKLTPYAAEITDTSGDKATVLSFSYQERPPQGTSGVSSPLMQHIILKRGERTNEIDFGPVAKIHFENEQTTITLKDGAVITGSIVISPIQVAYPSSSYPGLPNFPGMSTTTTKSLSMRATFVGWEELGLGAIVPFAIDVGKTKEVVFK